MSNAKLLAAMSIGLIAAACSGPYDRQAPAPQCFQGRDPVGAQLPRLRLCRRQRPLRPLCPARNARARRPVA